jgi:hypothetical protein
LAKRHVFALAGLPKKSLNLGIAVGVGEFLLGGR